MKSIKISSRIRKNLRWGVMFTALCLMTNPATSQPNNPTNPVPLDGGLSLLLAAGAGLGYRGYRNYRQNRGKDPDGKDNGMNRP